MRVYKKILMITALINIISFGNLARHDLNWSDYEDFGMNRGKFVAGRTGINVYKVDGSLSGKIEKPMPNFDGVADTGNKTFWNDSQIVSGVTHVNKVMNSMTLIKRHMRSDVELSENYINDVKAQKIKTTEIYKKRGLEVPILEDRGIYKKYSERYSNRNETEKEKYPYSTGIKIFSDADDVGGDYSLIRHEKIAFDAHLSETIDNFSKDISSDKLVARMGAGSNNIAYTKEKISQDGEIPYGRVTGGLNIITDATRVSRVEGVEDFKIALNEEAKTPIDSGTSGGDSGSPVFVWSDEKSNWLLAGANHGQITGKEGYTKTSLILSGEEKVREYIASLEDEEIVDGNEVKIEASKLIWNGKVRNPGNYDFKKGGFSKDGKNQTFNTENAKIHVVGGNNTGFSRFTFKKDATITGSPKYGFNTFITAGFIVEKDANLTYNMTDLAENTIRKIGEGTLILKGTAINRNTELNVGGKGKAILDNEHGYAAKHIRVAQGATVVLNRGNQLNGNNIYFGLRGGTLDLKGQNLSFNDIYHIDEGAKIGNSDSNQKSMFTFTQGKNRVFLGAFQGNIDVNYDPTTVVNGAKWDLRGNSNITGNLNIEKGKVSISGDNILHGYDLEVGENEFSKTTFTAENINVKDNTELTINRATKIDSNINVSRTGKLNILGKGRVLTEKDEKPDYEGAPKEEEINKIEIGEVLNNGDRSVDTTENKTINFEESTDKNFIVNLENNTTSVINSKIVGNLKGEKTGTGRLEIKNENNSVTGIMDIIDGKIIATSKKALSNVVSKIGEKAILEVEKVESLESVLENVDTTSNGVLSLGNDVLLDEKYKDYTSLYLSSAKDIVIGNENTSISSEIKKINLGGDNGTVTLKGLEYDTEEIGAGRQITVGNGTDKGTVIIDKIVRKNRDTIKIKDKSTLKVNEIEETKVIQTEIDLEYGASTEYKLKDSITNNSEGFLLLSETDKNVEVIKNTSLGTEKNVERSVNNVVTNSDYKFSGEGILNVDVEELENKNIIVDGQYREGGIVKISSNSNNYNGTVTVMGNKNNENRGNITLKIGREGTFGENSTFNVKDGGILDLNGTNLTAIISDTTNENGTITNSSNKKSKLVLNITDEKTLANKFTGNLDIEKNGAGTIEFTNTNNNFGTADNKGKVILNEGKLLYSTIGALNNNNEIIMNNESEIIVKANVLDIEITVNGRNNKFDFINSEGEIVVNSEIKGDKSSKLEIKKDSGKVILKNNFKEFNGELHLSNDIAKNNKVLNYELNSEKPEDRVINYSITGNGTFNNISEKDLTFKKLNDFSGTLVGENGDIVLDGEDALINKTDRAIAEGGTKVVVKNENDVQLVSNSDISVDLLNLKNDGSEANKVVKKGTGNLILKDNENVKIIDFREISVKEGGITLEKNVQGENGKYVVEKNAKLEFDAENVKLGNNLEGAGVISNKNSNSPLLIENNNLFTGEIYSNKGNIGIYSSNGDLNISKFTLGEKDIILSLGNEYNLTKKEIENKGDGWLVKTNKNKLIVDKNSLESIKNIKIDDGEVNLDEISSEKINTNIDILKEGKLTFKNSGMYIKNIKNEGNVEVVNQDLKIENYISNEGLLSIQKDEIDNKKVSIENNEGNINVFVKLSDNVLEGLKSQKMTLVDAKDKIKIVNLDEYNKDRNYQIVEEHIVRNNDIFNKKIEESKPVDDTSKPIEEPTAPVEDTPKPIEEPTAPVEDTPKPIEEPTAPVEDTPKPIEEPTAPVEDTSKPLEEVKFYSVLDPKTLNYLYILNGINSVNYDKNMLSYKNNIILNYLNNVEKNKNYEIFENTKYKNKISSNGIELLVESGKDRGNVALSQNLYLLASKNEVKTDVETQNLYKNSYNQLTMRPGIGIKKGIFDISTGLGITKTDISNGTKIVALNHTMNLGINPKIKIDEEKTLTYTNNIGYKYSPILSENITKKEEKIDKIKTKNPINLYYETGIKLETPNIEFMLGGEYIKNLYKMKIENGSEVVENRLKNDWELLGKAKLSLKTKNNLKLNVEIQSKIYQKNRSKQLIKTGIEYTW